VPGGRQTRAYVALLLIVLLWASFPTLIKLALADFPPFLFATLRCVCASLFLVATLARAEEAATRGLSSASLAPLFVLGVAGIFISMQLSYAAIYYSTASNALILQAATPVMVTLGAWRYLGERLRPGQWLGATASVVGVLVVITHGRLTGLRIEDIHVGDLINLVGIAGWSVYTVYGRRVLASHSPELATTGAYVIGTALMIPVTVLTLPYFPPPRLLSPFAWGVVIYQAVLGAIAHVWWYRAVQVVGPSRSAIFMNVQPVVGLLLAATILHERVGVGQLVGTGLVLGGVALTTRERRVSRRP
jgi:drug/metabolite transporter (DMT)-like permease